MKDKRYKFLKWLVFRDVVAKTTMSNKKVYYNNKKVKYLSISFRGAHNDIDGHFDHYVLEYPDILDDLNFREWYYTGTSIWNQPFCRDKSNDWQ